MRITTLAGGVGAAKLLSGLVDVVPPKQLTVIVNTGDDFDWMGLRVCPDLDTILYTLAGHANAVTGWGVQNDTFHMLERLAGLGGPQWFRIGDRDAALHLVRTQMLHAGETLTGVTRTLCAKLGVDCTVLPMTDSFVPTCIRTNEGLLDFQDYFVRRRCEPRVEGFVFRGIDSTAPAPGVTEAILDTDALIVCPSNPFISIGPILAVPGIRDLLRHARERVIAVSPLIAGRAMKGPTADMLRQLGYEASSATVARMYRDFVGRFVIDTSDAALAADISALGLKVETAPTLMDSPAARIGLASRVVEMCDEDGGASAHQRRA